MRLFGYTAEKILNIRGTLDKAVLPEMVLIVLKQLNKRHQKSPWLWTAHNQSLKQHPGDLLLDEVLFHIQEEFQQESTEIIGVTVGVTQLVSNCIEKPVATFRVQVGGQVVEDFKWSSRSVSSI
jgi:hypothetical protein